MASKPVASLRYQKAGGVCKDCNTCADKTHCAPVRKPLRPYDGIRLTADGFDCALPVALDSHSVCSFKCLYCFSNFLGGHGHTEVGQTRLNRLEHVLIGDSKDEKVRAFWKALKRDQKQPCPLQMGALTDPFDNIERNQGWALGLPALLEKYHQPIRVSTKGKLLMLPDYLDAWSKPDLVWVAFSLITTDDELLAKVDRYAPSSKERFATMKALSDRGVSTSLRFRPAIPGISDSTARKKHVWRDLIDKAADAGARAVSMEVLFVPGKLEPHDMFHWHELESLTGFPLQKIYREITPRYGACIRPSKAWTEELFLACHERTKKNGMAFGVSDPTWKELNDYGCCCGIAPDDPVFGNWQRENATNVVVEAKKAYDAGDTLREWSAADGIPEWAGKVPIQSMCMNTGIKSVMMRHYTWKDKLRVTWNDLRSARGPLKYFQGVLMPKRVLDGDVRYVYNPVAHKHEKTIWKIK